MKKWPLGVASGFFLFFGGVGAVQAVVILIVVWAVVDYAHKDGERRS
ncbi:MAG: hypothetical protein Q8Q36_02345 [bacterium]|nr:hypothetical protein [bacterium]